MKFVSIGNSLDMVPLDVARSILEAEGIPCLIPNEHLSTLLPHYSLAAGGIDLQVPEEMVTQATEILMVYRNTSPKEKDEPPVSNIESICLCPKCMSRNIEEVLKPETFSILSLFILLGVPVKIRKKRKHCKDCHFIWKESP